MILIIMSIKKTVFYSSTYHSLSAPPSWSSWSQSDWTPHTGSGPHRWSWHWGGGAWWCRSAPPVGTGRSCAPRRRRAPRRPCATLWTWASRCCWRPRSSESRCCRATPRTSRGGQWCLAWGSRLQCVGEGGVNQNTHITIITSKPVKTVGRNMKTQDYHIIIF